jgi:hypothetical protein
VVSSRRVIHRPVNCWPTEWNLPPMDTVPVALTVRWTSMGTPAAVEEFTVVGPVPRAASLTRNEDALNTDSTEVTRRSSYSTPAPIRRLSACSGVRLFCPSKPKFEEDWIPALMDRIIFAII